MTSRATLANAQARLPLPPTFNDPAAERHHRLQRLAAGFRLFAHYGFIEGLAGHITVRDPEFTDRFWVNPLGVPFAHIRIGDFICVNHAGDVISGNRPINRAAFVIHSRLHQQRSDIVAAAHAHSIYGKTWASLGRQLDPITQDACLFFNNHALFEEYTGVVINTEVGERIATTLAQNSALILQNHGLLTVGRSVDAALYLFLAMERCCQSQLLAEAVGHVQRIPDKIAQQTRDYLANDDALWQSFQPLYEFIVKQQPDVLENSVATQRLL